MVQSKSADASCFKLIGAGRRVAVGIQTFLLLPDHCLDHDHQCYLGDIAGQRAPS